MERTLSSGLVFESNAQQSNASLPLRALSTLLLWQRRMASRRQLARPTPACWPTPVSASRSVTKS